VIAGYLKCSIVTAGNLGTERHTLGMHTVCWNRSHESWILIDPRFSGHQRVGVQQPHAVIKGVFTDSYVIYILLLAVSFKKLKIYDQHSQSLGTVIFLG